MKVYLASKFLLSLGLVIVFIFLVKGNLKNISLERVKEKKLGSRREASYIKKQSEYIQGLAWWCRLGTSEYASLKVSSHV
jgi:hypothetical protein